MKGFTDQINSLEEKMSKRQKELDDSMKEIETRLDEEDAMTDKMLSEQAEMKMYFE
jgi:hypothetical protein